MNLNYTIAFCGLYVIIGMLFAMLDNWLEGRFDEDGSYIPNLKSPANIAMVFLWPLLLLIVIFLGIPMAIFDKVLSLRKSKKGHLNFLMELKPREKPTVSYEQEHLNRYVEKRIRP